MFLGIDPEAWKVLGIILGSILGGGVTTWFLMPVVIAKSKSEIRKNDTETAVTALEMANQSMKQVHDLRVQNDSILQTLRGDFQMTVNFSMIELIQNGSTSVQGKVIKMHNSRTDD